MSEEVYIPNKDWFSDDLGNELTVDEVDAGAVCVTVEGTDDTMMMNCSGGGGNCSITLTPGQTRALFSYLAGIVLPKVERRVITSPSGFPQLLENQRPCVRFLGLTQGVYLETDGSIRHGGVSFDPQQARAFAACLLAAADEAEGVV